MKQALRAWAGCAAAAALLLSGRSAERTTPAPAPLRDGERFVDLGLRTAYSPEALRPEPTTTAASCSTLT